MNSLKCFLIVSLGLFLFGCGGPLPINLNYQVPNNIKTQQNISSKKISIVSVQDIRGETPNYIGSLYLLATLPSGIELPSTTTFRAKQSIAAVIQKALSDSFAKAGYLVVAEDSDIKLAATLVSLKHSVTTHFMQHDVLNEKMIVQIELIAASSNQVVWKKTFNLNFS